MELLFRNVTLFTAFTFKGHFMSELQPDNALEIEFDDAEQEKPDQVEQDDGQESEGQETDSESATDNTAKERAVEFSEEQQKVLNEAIGKKVFKQREAERERDKLAKELEEIRKQIPKERRPEVPELPDPYALTDDQYRQQQAKRDEALRSAAAYDARQLQLQEQEQRVRAQQEQARQDALMEVVGSYTQRAKKLGVKPEELQEAAQTCGAFGLGGNDPLTQFILSDEHGPLITRYLAKNPLELEQLVAMPATQAAVRIATAIKQKAVALKPKVNTAPDPVDSPRSSGTSQKSRGPVGAIYE
jgi:hypothetical protein